jgi:acetolactate synthase-1/2/3 large subunit
VQRLHPGGAAPEQTAKAAQIISEAVRPFVLAGNGVIRGNASEALLRFAEKLNIPVATTFMAKGVIPDIHPLALGAIGLQTPDYVNHAFAQADVVITVGYDVVEYAPKSWNAKHDKKIVHVDMSPAEVDAAYIVNVGVVGDINSSLHALTKIAIPRSAAHGLQFRQMLHDELEQGRRDNSFPLKPQRILADLRAALADDGIVISDVGAHKLWLARLFPCLQPNTCIISNGFAAMGMAVPGAVAAKLVHPNRRVVAVTGDGGFLMNSQELETAVRLETPFVVLVFNDRSYGLIRWKQMQQFGQPAFVDFNNPDLVKYAESFDAVGCHIESADELAPALRAALNSNQLTIIDCPVDASENLRLTQRLGAFAMESGFVR